MAGERYVLLGLAPARSGWFRVVAQWAHSGSVPAEFVKCLSVEELRARLASGRPFSAALVDAELPGLDRDLVDVAARAGCAVVAVADHRSRLDRDHLGVSAVLPQHFDRKALLDVLRAHATMISRGDAVPGDGAPELAPAWRGRVVMVCGPGGTGSSTVSIALAQGLAADPRHGRSVLLADLALYAEQAMLHDARDVVPGVEELVEAHRARRLPAEEVRGLCFHVEERGYDLLLGLRQARAWSAVRPRAFESAFESLRGAYRVVICDADAEVEGEDQGGSLDVEERHVMARTAAAQADVVFAVGLPGMKGLHSLVRVINELQGCGVAPERIVPVLNRVPKSPRARAELAAAMAALSAASRVDASPSSPLFLPDRRVDESLRDGALLPEALSQPLVGAYAAVAEHPAPAKAGGPALVQPGTLGTWPTGGEQEAAFG